MIGKKSCSDPGHSSITRRDGKEDETVRFFSRLSSIQTEYEKESRETLQRSRNSSFRQSTALFFKSKEEIVQRLKGTLAQENLEEVYVEVLCLLFPTVEARESKTALPLIAFLKKIFDYDAPTHSTLFQKATKKDLGGLELHIEVIKGRNLPPKDLNGLSDPFCLLFVTQKEFSKRTKVIEKTVNPVWKETFKFAIKDMENDFLQIDVWDYDPESRMRDKFKGIFAVKGINSMNNFVREISHGRSSTQEFIGTVKIPIKELSAETVEKFVALENSENKGELYLSMALGVNKERSLAIDLYRCVLQVLIASEVSQSPSMVPFKWQNQSDGLSWSAYLQRQLKSGWGLKPNDVLLANWLAYSEMHVLFPLSGKIFPPLIHQLFETIQQGHYTNAQVSLAWRGAERLVSFFASFIENLHEFFPCSDTTGQLEYVLKALKELRGLTAPQLPTSVRASLLQRVILHDIKEAIERGANNFVKGAMRTFGVALDSQEFSKLSMAQQIDKLRKLGQVLNDDLAKGRNVVEKDFKDILGIDYHVITYTIYDKKFGELVEPLVGKFCKCLETAFECERKGGEIVENNCTLGDDEGGGLKDNCESSAQYFFQLYLCVKQFSDDKIRPPWTLTKWNISSSFHDWFYPGVTHMLDILGLKWIQWMKTAIQKDFHSQEIEQDLTDYKEGCKTSSSARDTIAIFYDIQRFWEILCWPNANQSLQIAIKIIRDLCGYSVSYAELVSHNFLNSDVKDASTPYFVSPRMCRFINNMEYVGVYTRQIASNLNVQDVQSQQERDSFMEKQGEIQRSGLEGVIHSLLRHFASKMSGDGESLICLVVELGEEEGEETVKKFDKMLLRVVDYYRTNLDIVANNLLIDYYEEASTLIWNQVIKVFQKVIARALKEERSWKRFKRLKKLFKHLKGFFEVNLVHRLPSKPVSLLNSQKTKDLSSTLEKYAASTLQIQSQYFQKRFERQKEKKGDYGVVAIRLYYNQQNCTLHIELLNARNLQSCDSNGESDPYGVIQLLPLHTFLQIPKMRTKVHKATLFPLFEEEFSALLKDDGMKGDGFVRIQIFDYDYIGRDEFLGEAFYPLSLIEGGQGPKNNQQSDTLFCNLTKPLESDLEYLNSNLAYRTYAKEAIRFIKSQTFNIEKIVKK